MKKLHLLLTVPEAVMKKAVKGGQIFMTASGAFNKRWNFFMTASGAFNKRWNFFMTASGAVNKRWGFFKDLSGR